MTVTHHLLILPALALLLICAGKHSIGRVHGFCLAKSRSSSSPKYLTPTTALFSSASTSAGSVGSENTDKKDNNNDGNAQVKVCVQQSLPTTLKTPQEARRAWLDYVWEKGGGLPFLRVIPKQESTTLELETTVQRRKLFPIGMEEELLAVEEDDKIDGTCQVQYTVQDGGLLSTEIVPGSHLGVVTFTYSPPPDNKGDEEARKEGVVQLVWDVTFDTTSASRTFIWQAVTKQTISDTCNNFQAAMAVPKLYSRQTMLKLSPKMKSAILKTAASNNDDDARRILQHVMDEWIQFCWKDGAGFPWPVPPIFPKGQDTRWIVPPFL